MFLLKFHLNSKIKSCVPERKDDPLRGVALELPLVLCLELELSERDTTQDSRTREHDVCTAPLAPEAV